MCNAIANFYTYQRQGFYQPEKLAKVPQEIMQALNLHKAQPGYCPGDGKPLSPEELNPPGKMPRMLCRECYEATFLRQKRTNCLVCGHPLPQHHITEQRKNPREVSNHICDSKACMALWGLLAAITHGIHPPLQQVSQQAQVIDSQPVQPQVGARPTAALDNKTTGDGVFLDMGTPQGEEDVAYLWRQ